MILARDVRFLARSVSRTLHFYLKPGVRVQGYPGASIPKTRKFLVYLKCMPGARSGIRKVWDTYIQIRGHRELCKLELLATEVEGMLAKVRSGEKFHSSMSKEEEIISLKSLAMAIYSEIGQINGDNQNFAVALDNLDRAARVLDYYDSSWRPLAATRDEIFKDIRFLLARWKTETLYDVLIINVGWASPIMPWPLLVLGTKMVKEGKRVRLMDGHSKESDILFEASRARLIGFSVMTAQIGAALRLTRQIKKLYPDKFIVWGGAHATLFPEQCLQENSIDFAISGDGEDALTSLSTSLENGDGNFRDIPGLGFRDNGSIVLNPMGRPACFEDAGPWQFDLLDMRNYLNWQMVLVDFKHPSISFLATRGCPRGCAFCINSVVKHTRLHRAKPVECVLDEIEQLIRRYHVRTINFPDDAFFINPNYFASFIEGIFKRNLKFEWGGSSHIADVLRHKDLILTAKKAGLVWTGGSGESGSNRLLKLIKKGITVEEDIECMHFFADNDILTANSFMTRLPTETPDETKATLDLIEHVKGIFRAKNNPSYIMGPSVFRPYPGSALYNMCVESGFKQPETLEEWERMILPDGHFKIDNITWLG